MQIAFAKQYPQSSLQFANERGFVRSKAKYDAKRLDKRTESSCFGCADDPDDEPLSYAWKMQHVDAASGRPQLLGRPSLNNIQLINVVPPVGMQTFSTSICDALGECSAYGPLMLTTRAPAHMVGAGSSLNDMSDKLRIQDESAVIQLISGISLSVRNDQHGRKLLQNQPTSEIRDFLASAVDSILIKSPIDRNLVDLTAQGLQAAVSVAVAEDEKSRNATREIVGTLLAAARISGVNKDGASNLAGVITTGISEVLNGSNGSAGEVNETAEQLNNFGDIVLSSLVPGQLPISIPGVVPVTLQKLAEDPGATNGLQISTASGGFFRLPSDGIGAQAGPTALELRVYEFNNMVDTHKFDTSNTSLPRSGESIAFDLLGVDVQTQAPITFQLNTAGAIFTMNLNESGKSTNSTNSTNPGQAVERCVFWDSKTNSWVSRGCSVLSVDASNGTVFCECFHLTEFSSSAAITVPAVNQVDPIGGASALLSASGVQIILIAVMVRLLDPMPACVDDYLTFGPDDSAAWDCMCLLAIFHHWCETGPGRLWRICESAC